MGSSRSVPAVSSRRGSRGCRARLGRGWVMRVLGSSQDRFEGGGVLIGFEALVFEGDGELSMLIPAAMEQLHDAHAALDQTAGHDGAVGEGAGLFYIRAVEIEDVLRFLGEIDQIGDGGLHAE